MYKIQLEVDGNNRWLTKMDYEYFCPVTISSDFYKKFLHKNFPFEIGDELDLFPYDKRSLPTIKPKLKDKELRKEAYRKATESNPVFLSSFNSKPKSTKEIYYDELMRLRYNAKLDHGIIPNLDYLYDRYVRPMDSICKRFDFNKFGGVFNLELESSSNDDFWYDWMISSQMHNGKLTFFDGDGDQTFKIEFWDSYCIHIGEQMNSIGSNAMTMQMRLSPAITRNRGVEHEKVWKQTNIHQEWKPAATPVQTTEKKQLLVKKLEGPFTEDGKKVEELIMGNNYIYKATEYNDGEGDKLNNTHWSVELDNNGKQSNLSKANAFAKDGAICYKYTPEKAENIRIYAWCNKASKDVSVEVPVVSFPFVIARSARRAGICKGTNGMDYTREDIKNLNVSYPAQIALLKQKLENGYDDLGIEYDNENPNEVADYLKTKNEIVNDALEYIDEYNKYSDSELFDIMRNDLDDWALGDLDDNLIKMIDFFKSNSSTSNRYEDKRLTNAIANHERTQSFIEGFRPLLERDINKNVHSLNQLKVNDIVHQFIKNDYNPEDGGNSAVLGIIGLQNLKALIYDNYFNGLGISVDGTQAYDIELTDFKLVNDQYEGEFLLEIFDHFGLDSSDILKDEKYLRHQEEFICWYMLQHLRGYKPFITYIPLKYKFKGTLHKGNLTILKNDN